MEKNQHPGFQIRLARLMQFRTQRSLARQVGILPSVLSDFEHKYRSLPEETVARLRAVLHQDRSEAER